jgi:N-hydroxyarylamine O-acetyltransferase
MTTFNFGEYSTRIGYSGSAGPDLATLTALHRAHIGAIPFENLDIQMGRTVKLDPDALQAKMVRQRRGGYCFEQNTLFMLALQSIGFAPATREARVRQNTGGVVRPRTHMVLTMPCEGREWLADVGFGGDGLWEPMALDGRSTQQAGVVYRVATEDSVQVLQRHITGGWEDLYAIMPNPVHPIDLEVGNWFTSTYRRSPFVLNLTAQRIVDDTRHTLRNLTYSVTRGTVVQVHEITRHEVVPLLRGTFGLEVPEHATFLALDSDVSPENDSNRNESNVAPSAAHC